VFFNSYTKAYNKRYSRSGTLFQGPDKVAHVSEQAYLLHLCRYIQANPVKDGLVVEPDDWPYSNYVEWVGLRSGTLVDRDFAREHFPTPESYRAFVFDYIRERELPRELEDCLREWEG
jgi:putative transposase